MHTPISSSRPTRAARRCAGFTLIEMMVVVSIAGILSSVAMPSFEGQLHRARRSDALVSMMQIQLSQERFRGNATAYGGLADIGVAARSASGHYTLQIPSTGADGYEALAAATGLQTRDAACRFMKLRSTNGSVTYASGPDASVANDDAANRKCWSL